jgi:succinate-semialdehyde dehydrogenase/glutarate-semialdehyde dehydrogenase/succinate-semialdehyde dehydrogenase
MVLIDLPPEAAIAKEEFFGPVTVIHAFKTDEEAVELANGTDFGLGAAVGSRDLERANRLASRIEAGWCSSMTSSTRTRARPSAA